MLLLDSVKTHLAHWGTCILLRTLAPVRNYLEGFTGLYVVMIIINNMLFEYVFWSKSEFKVALQCDKTVEGTVDPVVSDIITNKHVSTDSIQF